MNKNIRNIIIFAFVAFACGWLGVLVDKFIPEFWISSVKKIFL